MGGSTAGPPFDQIGSLLVLIAQAIAHQAPKPTLLGSTTALGLVAPTGSNRRKWRVRRGRLTEP